MDEKTPKSKLKKIYIEILNGSSLLEGTFFGNLYLKHLDVFDTEEIDEKRDQFIERATKEGLPTEEVRTKEIIESGDWSTAKDEEVRDLREYIAGMIRTKSKLFLRSEINRLDEQIKENQKKIDILISEKLELVGFTAENYADKKINDFYILYTLYKDKDLKEKHFSESSLDEISDDDLFKISSFYSQNLKRFKEENLKRIALSSFFLNNFYSCKDNPFVFYGKPVVKLTYYQNDLFSFGRYFKHLLSEMKHQPTPEQLDDPNSLLGSYNIAKNSEKTLSRSTEGATTIVGATKEDLKAMGISENKGEVVDLVKEASKKGGTLSMQDLMKLHGF